MNDVNLAFNYVMLSVITTHTFVALCVEIYTNLQNNKKMKNLLYIIAGLIVTIWIIVFRPNEIIHMLLALAALIMLITIFFDKKLSKNNKEITK